MAAEERAYVDIPAVGKVSEQDVLENYQQIKTQVARLIRTELERLKPMEASGKSDAGKGQTISF